MLAAEILAGRRVSIRVDEHTLMFFDPGTRQLLRTRPNPLTPNEILRLRTARPAGPPPQPATDPVSVQRRVSATGMVMVTGQVISLGRTHAGKTVTIHVHDNHLIADCDDGPRTVRRTTDKPVRNHKANRPQQRRLTMPAQRQAGA